MKRFPILVCCLLLAAAACSQAPKPENFTSSLRGDRVVCILYEQSEFKSAVVERVTAELRSDGYTVLTDLPDASEYYDADDYGAVVYMADYWMWHVPWHAKRYYNRNDRAGNIVVVVTSGDPDVRIDEPFDAVTSASRDDRVAPVAGEILGRLRAVLE